MSLSVADAARSRTPRYPARPRSAATVSSGAATVFEALMSESFPRGSSRHTIFCAAARAQGGCMIINTGARTDTVQYYTP